MESLTWFFFESAAALATVVFVVLFALLVHWRRSGRPRPLLIGLVMAVVLLIVQSAVVTRKERIDLVMKRVEAGIVDSRADALGEALSSSFRIDDVDWDRGEFIKHVQSYMRNVDVHTLSRSAFDMAGVDDRHVDVSIGYLADVDASGYAGMVPSHWTIRFVREGDQWRIEQILPTRLGARPLTSWRHLPNP